MRFELSSIESWFYINEYARKKDENIGGSFVCKPLKFYEKTISLRFSFKSLCDLAYKEKDKILVFFLNNFSKTNLLITYDDKLDCFFFHIGSGIPDGYNFQWDYIQNLW